MMKFLVVHFRAPVSRYHLRFQCLMANEAQLQRLVEWVAVPPYVNTHACYSICEMRAREPLPATAVAFFELEPADLNQRVYSDRVSFSSPQ